MLLRAVWLLAVLPLTLLTPQVPTEDGQVWISDILANPSRYWNVTVTIVGQVQDVNANPPGTTRGTYSLLDDSSNTPLTVRTRDLPPVGREFSVTGVIIQEPQQATVLMNEISRADPGSDTLLRNLLIAGSVLFVLLLVVLVRTMGSQKSAPAAASATGGGSQAPRPTPTPEPASFQTTRDAGADPTRKIDTAAGKADATKVFMNLGAEIKVEKGPDAGKTFALHKPVTNIGRPGVRKNDIELSDDTVSKEQAAIFYDSKKSAFTLRNQSSTNPTMVNDSVVGDTVTLEPDAVIQMGASTLRFSRD